MHNTEESLLFVDTKFRGLHSITRLDQRPTLKHRLGVCFVTSHGSIGNVNLSLTTLCDIHKDYTFCHNNLYDFCFQAVLPPLSK